MPAAMPLRRIFVSLFLRSPVAACPLVKLVLLCFGLSAKWDELGGAGGSKKDAVYAIGIRQPFLVLVVAPKPLSVSLLVCA